MKSNDFSKWAINYLKAAETLYKIENRTIGFWIPAYYLLHHSIELAIKAYIAKSTGSQPPKGHDIEKLFKNSSYSLTTDEGKAVQLLRQVNMGSGGLRYPQVGTNGPFLPSMFNSGAKLVKKLIK